MHVLKNSLASVAFATLLLFFGTSDVNASVTITSPTTNATHTTSSASITISGASSQSYSKIVWDNVTKGDAGLASISSSTWSAGSVSLKPGRNEILITGITSSGTTSTSRLIVERATSGPTISNISANTTTPIQYEKYELNFAVESAADYPMFMYDSNQPQNTNYQGVTVEAVIQTPSGKNVTHPAFYQQKTTKQSGIYVHTNQDGWTLRLAPQEVGTYQVSLRARDKNGSTTVSAGSFQSQPGTRAGFVRVSQQDPRYFEYTNGQLHWPIGLSWGVAGTAYGVNLNNSVLNHDRPWLGGDGIYTTRWARWLASNNDWGNEGAEAPLNFTEKFPSSELSYDLYYPQRFRIWINDWAEHGTPAYAVFKGNTTYQVKIRLKTQNISGPRIAGEPWGFTIKLGGWLGHQEPISTVETQLRNNFALVPHITTNSDWHTQLFNVTTPSSIPGSNLNVYLDNVSGGQVYIDELSIKPILAGGVLGGELVRFPKADMHTYVESRPAAYWDEKIGLAEQNDVKLRFVVHDKNDLIQNHLRTNGTFVPGNLSAGDGYYQAENTKATWLLKQWWRYLVARYGYSTSVFGWELNNEGSPDDTNHWRNTQIFGRWMRELDYHPHMSNTSFWCCWRPQFWKNNTQYPDVSFADVHTYGNPTDMVTWYLTESRNAYKDNVGKPIVRAETGTIDTNYRNNPVWYHNMLWAQLDYSSMFEIGYWYSEHTTGIDRDFHARIFHNFIKDIPLNKGGYQDIGATVSNANLQVLGQKNPVSRAAHFWVRNVNSRYTSGLPSGQSGTVSFTLNPNTAYTVERWDTWQPNAITTQSALSDGSGTISIAISSLQRDLALKIYPAGQSQTPTPAPTTSPAPSPCQQADINQDGVVDISDYTILAANFFKSPPANPRTDINQDGLVDLTDYSLLASQFFGSCN